MASIAARSASDSSRVSPVTSPTSSPPVRSPAPVVAAARVRARTCSLERASSPGEPAAVDRPGSRTTARCCWASQSPYPPAGNGRAVTRAVHTDPSGGGAPPCGAAATVSGSSSSAARSRVGCPATSVTRAGTCHPVAISRGSAATVNTTSALPPRAASCGSAPRSKVAERAAARTIPTSTTRTTAPGRTRTAWPSPPDRHVTTNTAPTAATVAAAARARPAVGFGAASAARSAANRVPRRAPTDAPATRATAHTTTGPTTAPAGGPGGGSVSSVTRR